MRMRSESTHIYKTKVVAVALYRRYDSRSLSKYSDQWYASLLIHSYRLIKRLAPLDDCNRILFNLSIARPALVNSSSLNGAIFLRCKMCDKLFVQVAPPVETAHNKVTVVGVGNVGMSCILTLLAQNVTNEIAMVDVDPKKLEGEMLDLQHGCRFFPNPKAIINAGTDYAITAGSKLCIITAGARQKEGESRLELVQRNADIFKRIVPELVKHSPDTIILVVSNPVDVITYITWKLSGLPKERVIGSGCVLDSSRFRYFLSEKLGVAASSVHGFIIGEHGDSSVPVWSGVNIAGVPLASVNPCLGEDDDPDDMQQLHKDVVGSAGKLIKLKGYTSSAVGFTATHIAKQILSNKRTIDATSTLVQGIHGIEQEVFLSLPCVLGANGVERIVVQNLTECEKARLHKSAQTIYDIQKDVVL